MDLKDISIGDLIHVYYYYVDEQHEKFSTLNHDDIYFGVVVRINESTISYVPILEMELTDPSSIVIVNLPNNMVKNCQLDHIARVTKLSTVTSIKDKWQGNKKI